MSKETEGMVARRVYADFIGDDATDLDILEVSLGIHRNARSKSDRDSMLLKAAILALSEAVERYRKKTGTRHPEYQEFLQWMQNGEKTETPEKEVVRLVPREQEEIAENA